jgi:antirestriction protein ArdC
MLGYSDPRWLTYKQVTELGGTVKKGEKSRQIVFWQMLNKADSDGKQRSIPLLKYFNVFNWEQTEGLKSDEQVLNKNESIIEAEDIVENYTDKPETLYGYSFAGYIPPKDQVVMPKQDNFNSSAEFYSTLFHELAHSTGHKDRLNRKTVVEKASFGSADYSEEELVAEFTSAFLCNYAGIDNTIENSGAYIQGWLKAFADKPEMIVQAASKAQKAADYILGIQNQEATA